MTYWDILEEQVKIWNSLMRNLKHEKPKEFQNLNWMPESNCNQVCEGEMCDE